MGNTLPTVEIKINLCKGCGLCVENCKPGVLLLSNLFNVLGYQYAEYKGAGCTGCEACYYTCPEPSALSVIKEVKEKLKAPQGDQK